MQARLKKEEYGFSLSLLIFQLLKTSENLICSETTEVLFTSAWAFLWWEGIFLNKSYQKGDTAVISNSGT